MQICIAHTLMQICTAHTLMQICAHCRDENLLKGELTISSGLYENIKKLATGNGKAKL